MKRDIELLTKVRDHILRYPEKLDMDSWAVIPADLVDFRDGTTAKVSCGTTACVAGWTVQLVGDKLAVNEWTSRAEDGTYRVLDCVAKNGKVCDIEDRARKLLGLSWDEAELLFFVDNDEVVPLLDDLIAGKSILEAPSDDDAYWNADVPV